MADVKITVGLDDSELQKQLKNINNDLKDTNKLYKELGKGDNFAKQLEVAEQKADQLTTKMKLQKVQIEKCEEELKQYRNQLKGLDEGSNEFQQMSNKIQTTEKKLEGLKNELKLTDAQLENVGNECKTLKGKLQGVGTEVQQADSKFGKLGKTLKTINFVAIGGALQSAGYALQNFGSNIVRSFVDGLDSSKEFTAELETQQFLLNQLPTDVQKTIDELGKSSIEFGFTEFQGKSVATDMASFLERQGLTGSVDLSEIFSRTLDLSAMYDLPVEEVGERIQKMMLGNFENSDALGFNMNVASIEEFLNCDWDKLSYAEKQVKALEYIMAQTDATTGRASQEAEGFASQWNLAQSNIEETKNTILGYMQEAILPLIQRFNEFIQPLRTWIDEHKELVAQIGLVVVAVSGVLAVLGSLLIPIGTIMMIMPVIQGAISGIGAVLGAICSPIGLIVVAIGALVAGLIYAYNHCEKFRDIVDTAWSFICDKIQQAIDFVMPYIQAFLDWLPTAWQNTTNFLSECWNILKDLLGQYFQHISDKAMEIWGALTSFWQENGAWITDLFTSIWNGIQYALSTIWGIIKKVAEDVFGFLQRFWDKWGGTITTLFTTIWNGVSNFLQGIWNGIKGKAETVFNLLKSFWNTWGEEIKTGFKLAWDIIVALVQTAWQTIATCFETTIDIIMGIVDFFIKVFQGDWEGAWESIQGTVEKVKDNIGGYVENIVGFFSGIGERIADFFSGIGSKIASKFSGIGTAIKNVLPDWVQSLFGLKDFSINLPSSSSLTPYRGGARTVEDSYKDTYLDTALYGFKDSVKTISLNDISPYADSTSNVSQSYATSYTTYSTGVYGGGYNKQPSNSNDGLGSKLDKLIALMSNQQPQFANMLNIERFENNTEKDIEALCKEMSYYLQIHNKRW